MTSPGPHSGSKRRSVGNQLSVEDNALDVIAKEADNRDAKSSAFLAEARKLRLDEREKNKKENENDDNDSGDDVENTPQITANNENISIPKVPNVSLPAPIKQPNNEKPVLEHMNSRDSAIEMQEKYKKVMLSNVQLDNEKRALTYEVDLLKDEMWDMEESLQQMKRNLQVANKEKDRLSGDVKELKTKCEKLCVDLVQRDHLIKTSGLALVTTDNAYSPPEDSEYTSGNNMSSAVLTAEHLEILADYTGSLGLFPKMSHHHTAPSRAQSLPQTKTTNISPGERLKKLFDERNEILEEKEKLAKELSELKSNSNVSQLQQQQQQQQQQLQYPQQQQFLLSSIASPMFDGVVFDDTHKNFTEMKLKLKKAEQEITTLQGNVTRLETQMIRYKSSSENLEKSEEDLKAEKRKLQIEVRTLTSRIEELESKNNSLTKRLEKLKTKTVVENN